MSKPTINDVTVIIPTRADLSHLQLCVSSLKQSYPTIKIIIGADNPTQEVRDWLGNTSKGYFDYVIYEPSEGQNRTGIIKVYQNLIDKVKTDFVYLVHDDMVFGSETINVLLTKWEPKTVLSSRRIEPPIYPSAPEKIILDLGTTPSNFMYNNFLDVEKQIVVKDKNVSVEGFFAPHFFKKEEWVGYDPLFYPQSREDSDLALRFMEAGIKLLTVWDSVVYHFSGKGSRRKDGDSDSKEWQLTNYKNTRNYIRKWKTINHTQFILPLKAPSITIGAVVLVGADIDLVPKFLDTMEPWFDEIVFVPDLNQSSEHGRKVQNLVKEYADTNERLQPNNFNPSKIKIIPRELNNDFAAQTNFGISYLTTEWCYRHDLDEELDSNALSNMRFMIQEHIKSNPNVSVFGIPRINTLDGKISNDIPREHWFNNNFNQYPLRPSNVKNPDFQFRLFRKDVEWTGVVHEVPVPVMERDFDSIVMIDSFNITHHKSRQRQFEQEQKYATIKPAAKSINKIVYDSVIYTDEGITKHAVEEIKELSKRGYQVFLLDNNYRDIHGEQFKEFYKPWNFQTEEYITIVNQPPERWNNSRHFKNRIGYLAFEGKLPKKWVEIINESNIIELWTPSNYCKNIFIESGVLKPITVIPHGFDPSVWTKQEKQPDEFSFLSVLTAHNNRKGHDLIARAFSEEFSKEEPVKLVFKVNKIYNPEESFNKEISKYINWSGNTNIEFIDKNLPEKDLVSLFHKHSCFVSASRCEGFGINILNAMASGMIVISSQDSGMDDFVQGRVPYLIDMKPSRWAKYNWVYERARWPEPSIESLKKQMRKAYNEKKATDTTGLDAWTWEKTVDKMLQRFTELGYSR